MCQFVISSATNQNVEQIQNTKWNYVTYVHIIPWSSNLITWRHASDRLLKERIDCVFQVSSSSVDFGWSDLRRNKIQAQIIRRAVHAKCTLRIFTASSIITNSLFVYVTPTPAHQDQQLINNLLLHLICVTKYKDSVSLMLFSVNNSKITNMLSNNTNYLLDCFKFNV